MPESKARTAQVQTPSGWHTKSVSQLLPGEKFRMLSANGALVAGLNGNTEFTAGAQVARLKPPTSELRTRVRERFAEFFAAQRPVACA